MCVYVCEYVCRITCTCMYACLFVCLFVCMYVCVCVCVCVLARGANNGHPCVLLQATTWVYISHGGYAHLPRVIKNAIIMDPRKVTQDSFHLSNGGKWFGFYSSLTLTVFFSFTNLCQYLDVLLIVRHCFNSK